MNTHTKFIFLFSLLLTTSLHAQKTRFGLKGGLNLSTLTVSGVNVKGDLSYKTGFHIGALIHNTITDKISVQTELLYSNQGYIYNEGNYEAVGNINYIAVPVMFVYYPVKKFSVEAGPQLSFLLSHKAEVSVYQFDEFDPLVSGGSSATVDLENTTQDVEFGMNVGAAYKINKNLFLSGRYNFGLSMVNKKEVGDGASNEKDRNSVFQFSIGYLF